MFALSGAKMTIRSYQRLDDEALVQAFAETAGQLGETVNNWLPANNNARRLLGISRALRARGTETRLLLSPLLDDTNRFVQYYAARHLEGLVPVRCRRIIEQNAKQGDAVAGDAGMHLDAVDSGIYKPD
jgi:alkanesulfonate monooxygenase SsuD/methylene tetrahydromethanopterin reductase-like flavin-dependent oxidoreductase (luciferase family)